MSQLDSLKRISYSPTISKIIWKLRLAKIFRQLYFLLNRPLGGIIRVAVGGLETNFYVNTPWELRALESAGDIGHERHILELVLSEIQEGDVVYDIGSNFGIFAIPLAKKVGPKGRVITFEPEQQSYNHFQKNLKLNGLTNVVSFSFALGDENKESKLFLGQVTGASSLVSQPIGGQEARIVKVVKGDSLVKDRKLPVPKLIKIDVEGYEYAVIQGLRATLSHPDCRIVCCEIHPQLLPKDIKTEQVISSLKSLGFNRINNYYRGTNEFHAIAYKGAPEKAQPKLKLLVCAFACLKDPDKRFGFGEGGEGVLGWNIVQQLSRFHQVSVLTYFDNRSSIEAMLREKPLSNTTFYYIDLPNWFLSFQRFQGGIQIYSFFWQLKAYLVARRLHKQLHFDIFHHITYANDWMASFIGALLPIPYIRGPGGGAHRVPENFLSEFSFLNRFSQHLRSFGQWLFRHEPFFVLGQKKAKAILVCNRESFEAIPKKWQRKTHLFPVIGVSKEDLYLLSKSKKTDNNRFKVISAGKFLPIKGFSLAIEAFKIFNDKYSESEFTIIGDGPEIGNLKNLVHKLGLENKVIFSGWLPREKLLEKMASSDIFLFPSLRDGGGAVVVEAMAAGLPVVCLDIGGPGFYIKRKYGIKIKPVSPEQTIQEMARALENLYFDRGLRIHLGKAARERAEEEYRWDRLGERLLEIYQEVFKI